MARVTYTGRASRIRIEDGSVLERLVPADVPDALARTLSPKEFDVVIPVRRPAGSRSKPKTGARRARTKKES